MERIYKVCAVGPMAYDYRSLINKMSTRLTDGKKEFNFTIITNDFNQVKEVDFILLCVGYNGPGKQDSKDDALAAFDKVKDISNIPIYVAMIELVCNMPEQELVKLTPPLFTIACDHGDFYTPFQFFLNSKEGLEVGELRPVDSKAHKHKCIEKREWYRSLTRM